MRRRRPGEAVRVRALCAFVALCALALPSTAGAAGSNILPQTGLPTGGPLSDAASQTVKDLTGTVNQTVTGVTDTVGSAVGTATNTVNDTIEQVKGGGATPPVTPPATPVPTPPLPDVTLPEVPNVTGSGSGSGSGDKGSPSSGNGGGKSGSGSSGKSSDPSVTGASSTGGSGGAATPPARRRARRLAKTPSGRRILRREQAAARRGQAAPLPAAKRTDTRRDGNFRPVPKHDDGGVTHTFQQVVKVVPGPIKVLLGILALLVVFFFARGQVIARRARFLGRQREQLLHDVGLLQEALLPEIPERLGELQASVAYRPADGPAAGGDFYDAFLLDDERVAIIVGDVSGHGRQALARTALMRYTLRAYLDAGLEPRRALKVAGEALDDDLGGDFATVVVAISDPARATLTYSSAGHPPPIVTGSGAFEPVTALSSPPIGAGMPTGQRQTTLHLPGDTIACFFTDGMIEAKRDGELIGRERLAQMVDELNGTASADKLLASVAAYAHETPDDMATCIVKPDVTAAKDHVPDRIEEVEVSLEDLRRDCVERFLANCGVHADVAALALKSVQAAVGEFGAALLRVRVDKLGARCEVESAAGVHDPLGTVPRAPRGELAA